jgi:hypothetical protein
LFWHSNVFSTRHSPLGVCEEYVKAFPLFS